MTSIDATQPRRRPIRRLLLWVAALVLLILVLPYVLTLLYVAINPVSTLMLGRWVTGQRVERTWVPLERMAAILPRSVIASEDARFCTHSGVDWKELQIAMEDAEDVSDMRGGSTIAQQTAKNLFLWPGRSIVRKVLEAPLALWLDLVLSKRRLIEIYLNIAEWGPDGQFGAEAGARRAFGRGVERLSAPEAATLAAVLPNPIRRDAQRASPSVRRIAARIASRAAGSGPIDACLRAG